MTLYLTTLLISDNLVLLFELNNITDEYECRITGSVVKMRIQESKASYYAKLLLVDFLVLYSLPTAFTIKRLFMKMCVNILYGKLNLYSLSICMLSLYCYVLIHPKIVFIHQRKRENLS